LTACPVIAATTAAAFAAAWWFKVQAERRGGMLTKSTPEPWLEVGARKNA